MRVQSVFEYLGQSQTVELWVHGKEFGRVRIQEIEPNFAWKIGDGTIISLWF